MTKEILGETTPLRVAIIGAGPSGMYAADSLFKSQLPVHVDAYDRLATPYGLLRGGVAPDHQKMKSVGKYYHRVASHPHFSFYGNVKVGTDISIDELRSFYDAIIITCGAESDRSLGLEGEHLIGSEAATAFVGWYNGHPDYQERHFDFSAPSVAVIGQGNVAIDVTRILAKTPKELAMSDITAHAASCLKKSKITDIYLIGRRGPVQAAFTQMEIRELGELDDCDIVVDPADLILNPASQEELANEKNIKAKKNIEILNDFSKRPLQGRSKRIHIKFFRSPLSLHGSDRVDALRLGITELSGNAGAQSAHLTNETETLDCGLVFRSVGYQGRPIEGVPFDYKKYVIPSIQGRVYNTDTPVPGLYVSGWIKRGPSGVLGSNKPDSAETVASLLADIASLTPCPKRDTDPLLHQLHQRGCRVITFDDWQRIDAEEVQRGESVGKPREKFTSTKDIIAFLDHK